MLVAVKRKDLEMVLQKVRPFSSPKAELEQYSTPATIAADMLWTAYVQGDVAGLKVADLGCGTGILAIGASLLGAAEVVGVETDADALRDAAKNVADSKTVVRLVRSDVREFREKVDTVIQNPPFGAQRRNADRPFLETAMDIAKVVYSLHMGETQEFLESMVKARGGRFEAQKRFKFEIPHTFAFHKKALSDVEVVLIRVQMG